MFPSTEELVNQHQQVAPGTHCNYMKLLEYHEVYFLEAQDSYYS